MFLWSEILHSGTVITIEASKQDTESGNTHQSDPVSQQSQPVIEDPELAQAVSLSLKTADQEKTLRELGNRARSLELDASTSIKVEALGKLTSSRRSLCYLCVLLGVW
ncbi:hypothetical protein POM88_050051 [Heracleum sosnowskyi]|uniref:Uncharacterized protein n=1 Tax=Heracleum sosnowskyi TaxID=360622 RepID=A0AAD8GWT3_9APIA|nr:hypothetical protein POM88_050051 [Heracleum sosnowskyi]